MLFGCLSLLTVLTVPRTVHAQLGWHALVGAQSHDKGRQALAFLPNEIWIHEGDSVTWRFDVDEIHTVTFLKTVPSPSQTRPPFPAGCGTPAAPVFSSNPAIFDGTKCVSTPPLVKGQTFTVKFPATGNFKLVCLIHSDMTAVVHVLDLSQTLPHDQFFYDDQAGDQREDLLSDKDRDNDHGERDRSHGDQHSAHSVTAGIGEVSATAGGSSTLSVMRFLHSPIVIHAGETVEFDNQDPVTPHTITFGIEPADPMPASANVTLDADGARHTVIHSTSDSAHSGFIVAAPQDRPGLAQSPVGVTRFRVTFPHAGVFPFICALHDDLGMKGNVIVRP
jgi:plastocyanin